MYIVCILQEKLVIRTIYGKIAQTYSEQGDLVHACTVRDLICLNGYNDVDLLDSTVN